LLDRLAEGRLDAVLLALPYAAEGIDVMELGDDPFLLACLPDHPLAALAVVTPSDLVSADLLLLDDGHCLRDQVLAVCQLPASRAAEGVRGTSLHTVIQMAASGLGVTLLPRLAVRAGAVQGTGLVVRPLVGDAKGRRLALAWRSSSPRQEEFRRLGGFIASVANSRAA
jgi:LysR family hydrogen peroxide-inducible transcriptional activator